MPQSRLRQPLNVSLLLIAFLLLLIGISKLHMQADETLSYITSNRSFLEAVDFTLFHDVHAPLWFMLAWIWEQFVGKSEFVGRVLSAFLALLTLVNLHQIGRENFKAKVFGYLPLLFLSVNAYFLVYTLEIRPYPLVMLVTCISYRFFLRWLDKRSLSSALFYGITLSLLLYTHYFLVFVILSQVAYFLVFKLFDWRLFKHGLLAGGLALVLLSPQILVLLYQLRFVRFTQGGTQGVPTSPTNLESIWDLLSLISNGWILLLLPVLLIGIWRLWRSPAYRIALFWFLLASSLLLLVNLRTPLLTTRYISYVAPALSLVLGLTLAACIQDFPKWRYGLWGLVLLLWGLQFGTLWTYFPIRIPFRELFAEVNASFQEGDLLFTNHQRFDNFLEDQYSRYLSPALLANLVTSLEEAKSARRAWFITDTIFSASYRDTFSEFEASHRVSQVIGDCTRDWCFVIQLMLAPPMREAVFFEDTIGFLGADIDPISNKQLPVMLWWMVEEVPQADYSIALQLLNTDGALVTQVDRQIQPPDFPEIPSSQMQVGGNYIDWRVLDLTNLPAGDYRLQLVVYQWQDGRRLTLPDGSDAYFIQMISLGES